MSSQSSLIATTWIDDYLDLYNYAHSIGDKEWQEDILRVLSERNERIEREEKELLKRELWRKFDSINFKLLDLFQKLRSSTNNHSSEKLMEQLFRLKLERIAISRKLHKIEH